MQIFIKTDKTLVLNVEPTELILGVVHKIEEKGYPPNFYLNYKGKPLDSTKQLTLYDYNIGKESTLHLSFRILAAIYSINVKYFTDTFKLTVKSSNTIEDIKTMISGKIGFPSKVIEAICFDGKVLSNESSLFSCGMRDDTTLSLVLHSYIIRFPIQIMATGKKFTIDIDNRNCVNCLTKKIENKEGSDLKVMRLICKGVTLENDKILSSYKIQEASTIAVIQRIERDVSHFTNQELDDFLNQYLKDFSAENLQHAPLLALNEKATRSNAHTDDGYDEYTEEVKQKDKNGVLSDEHIKILNDFVVYARMNSNVLNLRIILTDEMFLLLFDNDLELLKSLKRLSNFDDRNIILMSVKGTYVSFDMDDYDQDRNFHISLNVPEAGGVMCFFLSNSISTYRPKTGSLIEFNPTVLSAITQVQGIYNSLAIVDEASRLYRNENENDVIEANQTLIEAYNCRKETLSMKVSLHLREKTDLKDQCLKTDRDSKKRIRDLTTEIDVLRCRVNSAEETEVRITNMNLEQLNNAKKRARSRLDDIEVAEQDLLQSLQDEKMCVICKTEPKRIVILPCRHFALCLVCSNNPLLDCCPLCRKTVDSTIELFV